MPRTPEGGVPSEEMQAPKEARSELGKLYDEFAQKLETVQAKAAENLQNDLEKKQGLSEKLRNTYYAATDVSITGLAVRKIGMSPEEMRAAIANDHFPAALRIQIGYPPNYVHVEMEVRADRKEILSSYVDTYLNGDPAGTKRGMENSTRNRLERLGYKDMREEINARTQQLAEEYIKNMPKEIVEYVEMEKEHVKWGEIDLPYSRGKEIFYSGAGGGEAMDRAIKDAQVAVARDKAQHDAMHEFLTRE